MWARQDDEEPASEEIKDQATFNKMVEQAEHLLIPVHSEQPSHYTYLRVSRGTKVNIVYKDSLKTPSENSTATASRILQKLGVILDNEECPEPTNKSHQIDGFSCGLWVVRWIERDLREIRGEARHEPVSITDQTIRGKQFIQNIKKASLKADAKEENNSIMKASAKKASIKADAKKDEVTKTTPAERAEPDWETIEEAKKAALACGKCRTRKDGGKGCRICMGELTYSNTSGSEVTWPTSSRRS